MSQERLSQFFVPVDGGWQVAKSIREMVVFAPQNVIMHPPFTKLDLVSCRNLLIYLTPELQKKLLPLFHYSLNPGGVLFLGSAETIGTFGDLFAALNDEARLYRRLECGLRPEAFEFPSSPGAPPAPKALTPAANLQSLADQLLLQTLFPGRRAGQQPGRHPLHQRADGQVSGAGGGQGQLEHLRHGARGAALRTDSRLPQGASAEGSSHRQERDGNDHRRGASCGPDRPDHRRAGSLAGIGDARVCRRADAPRNETDGQSQPQARQPRAARPDGAGTRTSPPGRADHPEAMQASQEEAESANEELQSTNEELQSTNEELTTSREEMQSMNEELQTLNQELQAKIDGFENINNDMMNLIESTEIAALFLDDVLRVRLFTTGANKLFRLIPGDVGRPITDITCDLNYPELADDAREVLRTLVFREQQVATLDGRWFAVRIMPYLTREGMSRGGVVITFTDITVSKALEAQLRQTQTGLEEHIVEQDVRLEQADAKIQAKTRHGRAVKGAGEGPRPVKTPEGDQ